MSIAPIKYRLLLQEIARDPSQPVYVAAMKSGFTEKTARFQGKRLLNAALRWQQKQALENKEKNNSSFNQERENTGESIKEVKKRIYERIGLSEEQLLANVKELATQTKDYGVRLKVVRTLARDMEDPIELDPDIEQNIMPVLNITIREKIKPIAQYEQVENGSVERLSDTTSQKNYSAT